MRRAMIAGNWKMHKTTREARALAQELTSRIPRDAVEVVLCPPFTSLLTVSESIDGTGIELGAQNVFWEPKGAFTGEIAVDMLVDAGCRFVIVGHSERRQYFGETDETVNRRVKAALAGNLQPIICVGETLAERDAGETDQVVVRQIRGAYEGLTTNEAGKTVVAYEPVWAIGTGRASNGPDANNVCGRIRSTLAALFNPELADSVRILYGGSVKPQNMDEFASQEHIDGALVGGASLEADSFTGIIEATRKVKVRE